jgi:hypothetical protein
MRRRRFFRQFAGEGIAFLEELSGKPQLRLSGLSDLPDEPLFTLKPAFLPGVTVFAEGTRMLGRRSGGDPVDLYGLDDPGTFVLSRFDGWSPLGEIAAELESARSWSAASARSLAREVFLRLVADGFCAPANPPGAGPSVIPGKANARSGGDDE